MVGPGSFLRFRGRTVSDASQGLGFRVLPEIGFPTETHTCLKNLGFGVSEFPMKLYRSPFEICRFPRRSIELLQTRTYKLPYEIDACLKDSRFGVLRSLRRSNMSVSRKSSDFIRKSIDFLAEVYTCLKGSDILRTDT